MAAASILWLFEKDGPDVLHDAGLGLITQQLFFLDVGEWAIFGGLTVGFATIFAFCLRYGRPGIYALASSWILPAVIAPLYAAGLPGSQPFGPGLEIGRENDIRWPQLALGIQLATVTAFLFWKSFGLASTRRPQALALAIVGLALIPAAWALISLGLVWFNPN